MARQFANEWIAEYFSGTLDQAVLHVLVSDLAEDGNLCAVVTDACSAYYQSPITDLKTVVRPPRGEEPPGTLWRLLRAMPGLRGAGRYWQDHQGSIYTKEGYERFLGNPCVYYHRELRVKFINHGDDNFGIGTEANLAEYTRMMDENYDCSVGEVVGLADHLQKSCFFLKKEIKCIPAKGWTIEGNPQHVQNLIVQLGLETAKTAPTPGSADTGKGADADETLNQWEATEFMSGAGLGQRTGWMPALRRRSWQGTSAHLLEAHRRS